METIIFTLQTGMEVFMQPIMLVYALGGLLFGKDEVSSSNLDSSSTETRYPARDSGFFIFLSTWGETRF